MNDTVFSINGKIVAAEQALIPVTDRGFLYGDGIFETLHAYGRVIFKFRKHLDRLADGAKHLFFDPPNLAELKTWVQTAVDSAKFPEANVRLTVTRGSGPRGPSIKGPFTPTVVITVTRHDRPPESRFTEGVTAVVASFRRQETAVTSSLKTLNYIEQILAKREADIAGADEALLLNNAGMLCEGSASNIGLIREGRVLVPDPQRSGALPGIAQLTALEAARNLKIPVVMQCLSPWDPQTSDEAFLSGSMREITPLIRIGEKPIGSGKAGELTLKLIKEYRRIVERECAPYRFC